MLNFFKKTWKWFVGLFTVGVVLAAGVNTTLTTQIPANLQLKVTSAEVLQETTIGNVAYYQYRTSNKVDQQVNKGMVEIMANRTGNSQLFYGGKDKNDHDIYAVRTFLSDPFVQDAVGDWYYITTATTTKAAFDQQTVGFVESLIKRAYASVSDTNALNSLAIYGTSVLDNGTIYTANYAYNDGTTGINSLYHWTLPANPGGTIITKEDMFVYKYTQNLDPTGRVIDLNNMSRDWTFSNGNAYPNYLQYSSGNNWTTPGGDYSAPVIGSIVADNSINVWRDFVITGAYTWSDTPKIILHMHIAGDTGSEEYRTYNDGGGHIPYIEITYTTGAAGYSSKVNGIIPTVINGVPTSATTKINGI